MQSNGEQIGVVVVMEKTVVPGLARLAMRHGWEMIHLPTAGQVKKVIGRQRVHVAVVHMTVEVDQSAEFIQWLRMTQRDILLIAVASCHSEAVEQQVRLAGAHCYLPRDEWSYLDQAVSEALRQQSPPKEKERKDRRAVSSRGSRTPKRAVTG